MTSDSSHVQFLVHRIQLPRLYNSGLTFLFLTSLVCSLANTSSSPGLNKTPAQQLILKPVKSAVKVSSIRQVSRNMLNKKQGQVRFLYILQRAYVSATAIGRNRRKTMHKGC